MNKTIGSISNGNMSGTMIGGIIKADLTAKENIHASDINGESLARVWKSYGVNMTIDSAQLAKICDIIVLLVKPFLCSVVINQIKAVVKEDVIIVVIATRQSSEVIAQLFGRKTKIVKTMSNTPTFIGEGMTAIAPVENVIKEEIAEITTIFNSFGRGEIVPERLMDVVTVVSGSSPTYVYMTIEAIADVAAVEGASRPQVYKFVAQTVLGGAQMILETGEHPGELKDVVCSPGGMTIAAATEPEETGFRSGIMQSMRVCTDKSRKISK